MPAISLGGRLFFELPESLAYGIPNKLRPTPCAAWRHLFEPGSNLVVELYQQLFHMLEYMIEPRFKSMIEWLVRPPGGL